MKLQNDITIDLNGNCTVFGMNAHKLWINGNFPRTQQGSNKFFAFELVGEKWLLRAAQSTMTGISHYISEDRVLVDVSNA